MLVLLPPSEAKSPGGEGPSLAVAGLGPPRLAEVRGRILDAVSMLCTADPLAAQVSLKLPAATAQAALAANVAMLHGPTTAALDRFTGTLYSALDVPALDPPVREYADAHVLVFDGAFGVLRGAEPVPDHRVPASAVLPGLGSLVALWRPALRAVLPPAVGTGLAIDLRSTDYAAMWAVTGPLRAQVVSVRVLVERRVRRTWVRRNLSYQGKLHKGRLAAALLTAAVRDGPPQRLPQIARIAEAIGMRPEPRTVVGGHTALDLIVRE